MKLSLATLMMLASIGSAMAADQYDAIYVSDPAVCEQAKGRNVRDVLFDLNAAAVMPRVGIWMGELECKLNDVRMTQSVWGPVEEVSSTARCTGPYLDFIDGVTMTSDSSNINLAWGDKEGTPPSMIEVFSLLHGPSTDEERDADSYAGVYTLCEGITFDDIGT